MEPASCRRGENATRNQVTYFRSNCPGYEGAAGAGDGAGQDQAHYSQAVTLLLCPSRADNWWKEFFSWIIHQCVNWPCLPRWKMTNPIPALHTEESYIFYKYGALNNLTLDSQDRNHMRSIPQIWGFAWIPKQKFFSYSLQHYFVIVSDLPEFLITQYTGHRRCTGQLHHMAV